VSISEGETFHISEDACPWVCAERREEYTPWHLVVELLFILPTFLAGIYWLFWIPTYGLVLAIFYGTWAFGCYFVVFRVVLCPNCYYYGRWCPDGMGKFAKKVYGVKGNVQNYKKALLIPTIGWAVIFFFPPVMLFMAFLVTPSLNVPLGIAGVALPAFLYALLFLGLIILYFTVHIRLSCRGCAHRETCNLLKAFFFLRPLTRQNSRL